MLWYFLAVNNHLEWGMGGGGRETDKTQPRLSGAYSK